MFKERKVDHRTYRYADVKRLVAAHGGTAFDEMPMSVRLPEQFGTRIKRDIDTWRRVVQKAGVKPE